MYIDGWLQVNIVILDLRKQAWHVFKQLCENVALLKQQQKQIDGVCGRRGSPCLAEEPLLFTVRSALALKHQHSCWAICHFR